MKKLIISAALGAALMACSSTGGGGTASGAAQVVQTSTAGGANAQLNAIRAQAGQGGVTRNAALEAAARAHANDMVQRDFFSHTGSNGSTVGKRVRALGYRYCIVAENISKGQRTQTAVMQGWANSSGHYRNMVNRKASEFGFANVGDVWVMVLASRSC